MTQRDRNAGNRYSGRQAQGSEEFERGPETQGDAVSSTERRTNQMQQDAADFRYGTPPQSQSHSRRPSQQGAAPSPSPQSGQFGGHAATRPGGSENQHPGQFGYSQGGGAHDNWGAFEGDQQRQNPGYGQDEPWQHYHDADYLRWREEHLRQLDEEYAAWRHERYGKFSEEFSQWRSSRQHMSGGNATGPHQTKETDKARSEEHTSLHGKLK